MSKVKELENIIAFLTTQKDEMEKELNSLRNQVLSGKSKAFSKSVEVIVPHKDEFLLLKIGYNLESTDAKILERTPSEKEFMRAIFKAKTLVENQLKPKYNS